MNYWQTLPPEGIDFYYSNSSNTRMWDLALKSIQRKKQIPYLKDHTNYRLIRTKADSDCKTHW